MADPFFASLDFFKRSLARASGSYQMSELELEARFLQVPLEGQPEQPLTSAMWFHFKEWIETQTKGTASSTTDYTYNDNFRRTVDQMTGEETWRQKKRLDFQHWNNLATKIVLSSEVILAEKPDVKRDTVVIRTKERMSYLIFNSSMRVDMTKVSMTDEHKKEVTTYEIEVELIKWDELSQFLQKISYLWGHVHQSEQGRVSL
jgi:hypothetical protein